MHDGAADRLTIVDWIELNDLNINYPNLGNHIFGAQRSKILKVMFLEKLVHFKNVRFVSNSRF